MKCPKCFRGALVPLTTQSEPHFCDLCGKVSFPIERKNKEIWQAEDGIRYNNNGAIILFNTDMEEAKKIIAKEEKKK